MRTIEKRFLMYVSKKTALDQQAAEADVLRAVREGGYPIERVDVELAADMPEMPRHWVVVAVFNARNDEQWAELMRRLHARFNEWTNPAIIVGPEKARSNP